uniref:Saposin B-type domain-containing protein n=1 Tax=Branchiostoma floridae TaxID=7739 RepID=C3YC08_BRAFL|eukprot:XP_002606173.1 hypothetical protein BRAFLDRAFT_126493 [Branchiostoma floridae]
MVWEFDKDLCITIILSNFILGTILPSSSHLNRIRITVSPMIKYLFSECSTEMAESAIKHTSDLERRLEASVPGGREKKLLTRQVIQHIKGAASASPDQFAPEIQTVASLNATLASAHLVLGISRPAPFDHKFCTWAKQQPDLTTPFDEATLQRMDPIQKNSEVTRTLTSCCYISDDEPIIDQCMSSVREKVLDELCWEQEVVETGLPLLDASVVSEFPVGLKTIMSYKDDIPAHPCCHKSHTNRYSCFSQEWFGFEAHRDTYDHTAEIAQYKEMFAQLESKIVTLAQEMGQTEAAGLSCETCQLSLSYVDKMLQYNATKKEITTALNEVCSYVPAQIGGECTDLMKQYRPEIIQLLLQHVQPDIICKDLRLCISSNVARLAKGRCDCYRTGM